MSNRKRIHVGIVFVISFIAVFILNQLTYFTSDDYTYHFIYKGHMPTPDIEKIDGFKSIIESQINHYNLWNGRYLAHSIVQFFLQYDKIIFNLFNTLAFLLLAILIFFIVNSVVKVKRTTLLFTQIILLLWLFIPSFGQTVLWVSGSGNYLWSSLFYTGFLLFCIKNFNDSFIVILSSIVIGFLAGVTNENSGPATILMVLLIFVLNLFINKKFKAYQIIGAISSVIGFVSMMSSAGSLKRGKIDLTADIILNNLNDIFKSSLIHFYYIYILILILLLILSLTKQVNKKDLLFIFILSIGHFASIYSLIFVSYKPLRVLFGAAIFIIIIAAYLLNRLYTFKYMQILITLGLLLFSLYNYYYAIKDNATTYSQVMKQVTILENAEPNQDVTVTMITSPTTNYNAFNSTANVKPDKDAWFNQWMAKYFNVKSITGKPN